MLLGVGGATGVNKSSVAQDGHNLYVAAGDAVYSLSMPTLNLVWCIKVDSATCFGVYWLLDQDCILTWGELEIGCYSRAGEKFWAVTGPDIFTEGFEVAGNVARVTDFNGDVYSINLNHGQMTRVRP